MQFDHQQSSKSTDCACLIHRVACDLGVDHGVRMPGYLRMPDHRRIIAFLNEHCARCKIQPGAIALFRVDSYPNPQHLGIILENTDYVIHACGRFKRVLDQRIPPHFQRAGYWRFHEMPDARP